MFHEILMGYFCGFYGGSPWMAGDIGIFCGIFHGLFCIFYGLFCEMIYGICYGILDGIFDGIFLWHNQGYSMEYVVGYFMDLYGIFGYFVWIVGCWHWMASLAYCLGIIGWYPAEHSNGWKLVKSCDWKKAMELVTKLRIAHCSDFFCGFYLGFSALWLGAIHGKSGKRKRLDVIDKTQSQPNCITHHYSHNISTNTSICHRKMWCFSCSNFGILIAALEGLQIRVGFEAMPSRLPFDLAFVSWKKGGATMLCGMVRLKGWHRFDMVWYVLI